MTDRNEINSNGKNSNENKSNENGCSENNGNGKNSRKRPFTPLSIRLARELFRSNIRVFTVILAALTLIFSPLSCRLNIRHVRDLQNIILYQYTHMIEEIQNIVDFTETRINSCDRSMLGNESAMALLLEDVVQGYRNTAVVHIFLETPEGTVLESINNRELSAYHDLLQSTGSGYSRLLDGTVSVFISEPVSYVNTFDRDSQMICYGSRIDASGKDYVITVFYDISSYVSCTGSLLSNYVITDRKGSVLFSEGISDACAENTPERSTEREGTSFLPSGLLLYEKDFLTGYTVSSVTAYPELLGYALVVLLTIVIVLGITLLLGYRSIHKISEEALRPLSRLRDIMTTYSLGQTVRPDIHTGDEIEALSDRFCEMVHDIEFQFELASGARQAKALSEYKLLATQIDPHYIYNTLSVINAEARQRNFESVIAINTALSRVLRTVLSVNRSVFTTVAEEMETLQAYVRIMQYRYNENVSVTCEIQPVAEKKMVPRNILQPLVENSFLHGLQRENGEIYGTISVDVYLDGGSMVIEVNDDGIGMTEETVRMLTAGIEHNNDSREHIGINNVRQRLNCVYGSDASMEIRSEPGYGTTIVLIIPTDSASTLWGEINLN